jgi:hypothetical protein
VRHEHDAGSRGAELLFFGLVVAAKWSAMKRSATDGAGIADHLAGGGAAGLGVV